MKKLTKSHIYLEEIHIKTVLYNILLGLKFLHSAKIIHRDMKSANVLVNEDCTVKLCDFGLARCINTVTTEFERMYELAGEPHEARRHQNP